MATWIWILIAVFVVLALLIVLAAARRRQQLKSRFGPEYDRTVEEKGTRKGLSDLRTREKRRDALDIRPLPADKQAQYASAWVSIQTKFVNDPAEAVDAADALVAKVMTDRGYPMDNFEQAAEDVSVDHPEVVNDYREAHAVAMSSSEGRATTEDLRQATVRYRSLFERLLESRPA